MRKENIYKFLYLISALLLVGFCIRLAADYFKSYLVLSSPFYIYLLERVLEFIIPSIVCFIAGKNAKKKINNK